MKRVGDFFGLLSEGVYVNGGRSYIRPPGALRDAEFLRLCDRCGLCADACPKNIIVKLGTEYNAAAGTPAVVPSGDICDFCLRCIEACTTGALKRPGRRRDLKLGLAVIFPNNCLSWGDSVICNLCKFKCPRRAIECQPMKFSHNPVVNPSYCNGCGLCEYLCPATPKAVKVVGLTG